MSIRNQRKGIKRKKWNWIKGKICNERKDQKLKRKCCKLYYFKTKYITRRKNNKKNKKKILNKK